MDEIKLKYSTLMRLNAEILMDKSATETDKMEAYRSIIKAGELLDRDHAK